MKVLRLNAYFTPEVTAGNHLINDLCEGMADKKIYCEIITPVPSRGVSDLIRNEYKKRKLEQIYNGYITIRRFSMFREGKNPIQRAVRYGLCNIVEYWKGIQSKNIDIVFSSSTPPTQGMLSALVAKRLSKRYKRKVPFIYNLQDIFPDSLVNSGLTNEGSMIWKIGRKIENYTYNSADKIIVISNTMKNNLVKKGVVEEKIKVISNWIDVDKVIPVSRDKNELYLKYNFNKHEFIILYAGNFGAAQGSEIILDVAEQLEDYSDIKFVIFGGGAYFKDAVKKASSMNNVYINELLPQEYVSKVYSLGDVALITCKLGTGNAGMPSKTWSIMACNRPIIASFDKDSELDNVLKKANAGKCAEAENVDELKNMVLDYYNEWKKFGCLKANSREYVEKHASKEVCVSKYIDILQMVNSNNKN